MQHNDLHQNDLVTEKQHANQYKDGETVKHQKATKNSGIDMTSNKMEEDLDILDQPLPQNISILCDIVEHHSQSPSIVCTAAPVVVDGERLACQEKHSNLLEGDLEGWES